MKIGKLKMLLIAAVLFGITSELFAVAYMTDEQGTVAMWSMDARSSLRVLDSNTTRANDLSLYGGASVFTWGIGQDLTDAIVFNGTGGNGGRAVSINAWDTAATQFMFQGQVNAARIEAFAGNEQTFFHINNSVLLNCRGSRFYMGVTPSSGSVVWIETSISYTSGNWYNVSAIINPDGSFSLTVDDETVYGSTGTGDWKRVAGEKMYVGANRYGLAGFEGMMDNIKVSVVPEPATVSLLAGGIWLAAIKRRAGKK